MKSIIRNNRKGVCYICSRVTQTEEHHIFSGPNRQHSEKYGLKVYLCPYCHRDNKNGVHGNKEITDRLHRIGQTAFERNHTRAEFMAIFGKNYLENPDSSDRQQDDKEPAWGEKRISTGCKKFTGRN